MVTLCPACRMVEYADGQGLGLDAFDLVVYSGGDGTLNMIVSFCREKNLDTTVAYVPSGSTNDYAYSIGIPRNMDDFSKKSNKERKKYIGKDYERKK